MWQRRSSQVGFVDANRRECGTGAACGEFDVDSSTTSASGSNAAAATPTTAARAATPYSASPSTSGSSTRAGTGRHNSQ